MTRTRNFSRIALVAHIAIVAVISLAAYQGALDLVPTMALPFADKVMHFLLFGGIAFWITDGWANPRLMYLPLGLAIPLVIATLDESLQAFSPLRNADFGDWMANALGAVAFWLIACRRWRSCPAV